MNGKHVIPFLSLLVMSSFPIVGAQQPRPAYPPGQPSRERGSILTQTEVKTFSGRISKNNGKYVLEDLTEKTSYLLDDQRSAKKYAGKTVLVTGTLDSSNIIHVQKIAEAA
jgi:Protein of unknown function (DUF5818)